jgi:glycosyltransferase involved in cell wall biosynthesis
VKNIVMIGTGLETHGGISTVVRTWREHGLFERFPVEYIATHRDGSALVKLGAAVNALLRFLWLVLTRPAAILHVHGASRASFWRKLPFMAIARAAGWRVVFHLHGGGFKRFYQKGCGPVGRRLVRWVLDGADAIVVVSERWGRWVREVTPNRSIVCIPNPVAFNAGANPVRGGALVVFCGRVEEGKGVYELLEATAAVARTIPEVRLEVAGDGETERLARRASELGIRAHVHLPGWIDAKRRDELLARATVFVLPSHAEGLPLAVLEAMSAGCAVVASSVGGIPDVITDGVDGILVPARDPKALAAALRRVLTDPATGTRLGSNARATVAAKYSPERAMERLENLYAGLGARRVPGPAATAARRLQEIS